MATSTSSGPDPTGTRPTPPIAPGRRWPGPVLVGVGLVFLGIQLALVPRPLGVSTDEATYLAMVDPRVPALYWTAPRAWGVPALALPVAVTGAGLPVIRLYFAGLSGLGLVAAFWPWLRVLRPWVAPLAALLFSTLWVTVYFGSLVMPNLHVGLGVVAATGWFLRAAVAPRWWRCCAAGAAAAFVALVRPQDSVLVLGTVFLCALLVPRLRRPAPLVALPLGVATGWLPWVVEAYHRFGDPVARLRRAETAGPHGLSPDLSRLSIVPRMLDGAPMYCCEGRPPSAAGPMPLALTVWLVSWVLLVLLGIVLARRRGFLPDVVLLCLPAAALAAFYVLLPAFTTLRFLLPAFALLSLVVAAALVELPEARPGARRLAVVVVLLGLVVHIALMLPVARRALDTASTSRAREMEIAAALRPLVDGPPCLVAGTAGRAAAYYLGCAVHSGRPHRHPPARVRQAEAVGAAVVWVLREKLPPDSHLATWQQVDVPAMPPGWHVYLPPM